MAFLSEASYIVLGVQVATLLLITAGAYFMKVMKKRRLHGMIMTVLVVVNLVTVIAIMLPTYRVLTAGGGGEGSLLATVHHLIGLVALAMTIVVAFSWVLRGASDRGCLGLRRKGRLIMRSTFAMWAISILLGIAVFLMAL